MNVVIETKSSICCLKRKTLKLQALKVYHASPVFVKGHKRKKTGFFKITTRESRFPFIFGPNARCISLAE